MDFFAPGKGARRCDHSALPVACYGVTPWSRNRWFVCPLQVNGGLFAIDLESE
jgi:hypothetical protein